MEEATSLTSHCLWNRCPCTWSPAHTAWDTRTKPSLSVRVCCRPPRAEVERVESKESFMPQRLWQRWGGHSLQVREKLPSENRLDEASISAQVSTDQSLNNAVPCCENWLCCHHKKLKINLLSFMFCLSLGHHGQAESTVNFCTSSAHSFSTGPEGHHTVTGKSDMVSFRMRCIWKSSLVSLQFPNFLQERHQEALLRKMCSMKLNTPWCRGHRVAAAECTCFQGEEGEHISDKNV